MATYEELLLSGAVSLLTLLQYARLANQPLDTIAFAATLCEMLNQLEAKQPGLTIELGWQPVPAQPWKENNVSTAQNRTKDSAEHYIAEDLFGVSGSVSLS